MIRIIRCCDSVSIEENFDPDIITECAEGSYICSVKKCRKKKVNGRCELNYIRFYADYDYCLEADVEDVKEFQGRYRFLSNFWPVEVWYEGLKYLSSEAAFQAAKTSDMEKRKEFTTMKPGKAKKAGQFVELRDDWELVKNRVMYEIVKYKFSKNMEMRDLLLNTFDAEIEEGNTWDDTYWGICGGKGSNVLGLILMRVRAELRVERMRQIRRKSV